MQLDIKRTIFKIQLRRFILAVVSVTLIILIVFLRYYEEKILGINKTLLIILLIGIYFGYIIIEMIRQPFYIFFTDEGDKLIFRYFSLSIFNRMKSSIEIPKNEFEKYDISKSAYGMKEKIIFFRKTKQGIAKYPPVSITALSKQEKEKLLNTLKRYVK